MSKQVPTISWQNISFVKIFQAAADDRYYVEIIMTNKDVYGFRVKKENEQEKAFGKDSIDSHWETDWDYSLGNGGAETEEEKQELLYLMSLSDFSHAYNYETGQQIL